MFSLSFQDPHSPRFLFLLEDEDFCFTRARSDEPKENHFGEDAKTIVGDHFGRQN